MRLASAGRRTWKTDMPPQAENTEMKLYK